MSKPRTYSFGWSPAVWLCLAVCALVYARSLFFPHISWDDREMLFANRDVKNFEVAELFSNQYVGNYIPVTMCVHALAYFLFGDQDLFHHLLNLVLHLFNAVLVYHFSMRLFHNSHHALIALLVFSLHPLQVETVLWISELKNILSTLFLLSALLGWLNYREAKKNKWYWISFSAFVFALLSKPSAVVLPLLLVLLDWYLKIRFKPTRLVVYLPFIILSGLLAYVTLQTQSAGQFINHSHEFPWWQRIAFAGYGLMTYFRLFFVPYPQSIIYPFPEANGLNFGIGFTFLLVAVLLVVYLMKHKSKDLLFLFGYILFNFLLVLQFIPFGEVLNADRYAYVPLIGFAWLVGIMFRRLQFSLKILLLTLLPFFAFLTFSRSLVWKNALTLYENILEIYPNSFVALNSAGIECMRMDLDKKALDYFNRSVKAKPENYKTHYNRGLIYLKNRENAKAILDFNNCLGIYDYHKAYTARATAYLQAGDLSKAQQDAKRAIELNPKNGNAHFVLANVYEKTGQLEQALEQYNQSIALAPEEADYYFRRAIVYGKKQDFVSCKKDLDLSITLKPQQSEAYYWRAVAKINLGESACDDFAVAAKENFEPAVKAFNTHCR